MPAERTGHRSVDSCSKAIAHPMRFLWRII